MRDHARNYGFQSNKELMLYLKDSGYIRSNFIFDIMCLVDRKNFTTNSYTAYRDRPEAVAYEKTISAPHMHAEVLEQMSESLRHGKCALDIGSGSGYLTICMALALGEKGKVIGVDCIPGFQIMANQIAQNHYPEVLQNNRVEYIVYDGRRGWPWGGPYDAIHVGVAAESIPEALIEQLAPGGCLVMPIGLREDQVLVLLKKSLNGDVQKKELMRVRYGTFTKVDLPWSSDVESDSILHQEMRNKNTITPKSQANNTPTNKLFTKESIKNPIEATQADKEAENKILENIDDRIDKNGTNKDTYLFNQIEKIQCSIPKNLVSNTNERKGVFDKLQVCENKDDCNKSKSQEDFISKKIDPETALIGDLEKNSDSVLIKAKSYDKNLEIVSQIEDVNDSNDLYKNTLTENMIIYKSVLELESINPKSIEGDEKAQTVNENDSDNTEKGIDELERNTCDLETSKSQEVDSFTEDSDEVSSVDTQIDAEAFYEDCKNCNDISISVPSDPRVCIGSKSFSKSLENFSTINEHVPNLRSSNSTIIASDKYKTPNVREKIELFEKNIRNCKILNSQDNIAIKINLIPKENDDPVMKDTNEKFQVLENSKYNTVLQTGVDIHHTNQEIHDGNSFSKSVENLTKIDEPGPISQFNGSTILNGNNTETIQHKIDIVQENTEKIQNYNEQIDEKEQNHFSKENSEKMEQHEANHESISSEFKLFKNEIKVILNDFLSSEKENHEEIIKLRHVNLHIDQIHQVQLVNNLDEKVESNSPNLEQSEKSYENLENDVANKKLSAENQGENSDDLQIQVTNISEKVEQLQTQYDNNIKDLMATNKELQERIIHYENLEKRLQNLEKKFKLMTKVLAKLIDKSNCHDKVLSLQLAITEKEEASLELEKQKREQTEEKINNIISAISRIGEEIKVTECNFVDNTTKENDQHVVEQCLLASNAYSSNPESFLTELNLIKTLLNLERKNSVVEKETSSKNESECTDDESEMNLLQMILELEQ